MKKLFKERFIGLLDEDDLYDELKMRIQTKNESIDEFIGTFKYMAHRLSHAPSTRELAKMAYKNLLPEYRKYINGREADSFKTLLKLGREWEKEKRIDERQALLMGKRIEKAAALQEVKDQTEKKSDKAARKNKKKNVADTQSEELCAEIAAIQVDKPREQGNQRQNAQQPPGQQEARFPNNNLGQQPNRQQSRRPPQSVAQVQRFLDRRPS